MAQNITEQQVMDRAIKQYKIEIEKGISGKGVCV